MPVRLRRRTRLRSCRATTLPNRPRTRGEHFRRAAAQDRRGLHAAQTFCTDSSASRLGSGNAATSRHCSTDAPSTSSISRTKSFTRSSSGSTTANSSTATCSLRSSTSTPTMSPPIAPIRDATRPSAPGRSGSQTRTRRLGTNAGYGSSARSAPAATSRSCAVLVHCARVERIGIMGGTFDPIHVAHLVAAASARYACDLDRVLLVVAGDPWQKHGTVVASAAARYDMVAAALDDVRRLRSVSSGDRPAGPLVHGRHCRGALGSRARARLDHRRRRGGAARHLAALRRAARPRDLGGGRARAMSRVPRPRGGAAFPFPCPASTCRPPSSGGGSHRANRSTFSSPPRPCV